MVATLVVSASEHATFLLEPFAGSYEVLPEVLPIVKTRNAFN